MEDDYREHVIQKPEKKPPTIIQLNIGRKDLVILLLSIIIFGGGLFYGQRFEAHYENQAFKKQSQMTQDIVRVLTMPPWLGQKFREAGYLVNDAQMEQPNPIQIPEVIEPQPTESYE